MKKLLFSVIFLFVCNYVNSQNYFGTSTNSVNSNFDLSHLGTFTLGSTFESMNDPWRAGEGRLLELYKPSGNVSFKLGNAFGKLSFNIAGHNGAFFPSAQNGDIVIRKHSSKKVYFSLNTSNGTGDSAFIFVDSSNRQTLSILNNGKVGVGTTNPLEKLHINGSIRGNIGTGALRIKSGSGYIDVGALNTSYAHIYTDRPKIIFNKDVYTTTNAFSSYSSDLILKTAGSEKFRIKRSNCFVGIGTNNPSGKLHVKGETYIDGGWLRVLGNQGLYFQNHGGGLFMQDATCILTYVNKSFYNNTCILRTDGTFQVGSSGNRFLVKTDG
jgi:hypothetical protein